MKDYIDKKYVKYEEPDEISWTIIRPLPFLRGKERNQTTLNYIQALRPSVLRVTTSIIADTRRNWRVTVVLDENNIIADIIQEVEVGCIDFDNAYDMDISINRTNI